MATWRALDAVVSAMVSALADHPDRTEIDTDLDVQSYTVSDFRTPMTSGVSLLAFRIDVDGTLRTPEPAPDEFGVRRLAQLPIDLHLLLTAWGRDASVQLAVAAWMMRVLADHSVLDAGRLNAVAPGTFDADESVTLQPSAIPSEDLLRLWELLGPTSFQLSVPYLVRGVRIDSTVTVDEHDPVVEREFRYHRLEAPA